MSRRLLAFLLSELKTVRLICQRPQCGAVTEMSVESLGARFANRTPGCPVCNHDFAGVAAGDRDSQNALVRLADAILAIQGVGRSTPAGVEVEFVLPDPQV
ncbi:MAG TPA: hypothetical protein VD866_17890 [Urbifossiella sp.]|nr:hypothetical protein [Urbifossiella sp.]